MNGIAILSSFDKYTTFSYAGKTLTFRTCDGLDKYTKIQKWDEVLGNVETTLDDQQSPRRNLNQFIIYGDGFFLYIRRRHIECLQYVFLGCSNSPA